MCSVLRVLRVLHVLRVLCAVLCALCVPCVRAPSPVCTEVTPDLNLPKLVQILGRADHQRAVVLVDVRPAAQLLEILPSLTCAGRPGTRAGWVSVLLLEWLRDAV